MSIGDRELEARAQQRIGTVVRGKYRLERVLGVGGMGTVYEARHRNSARFALKILHPELTLRDSVRQRFQREGYAANSVHHAGAVRVVDDDVTEDGAAFLVMELLEGASVETLWQGHGEHLPVAVTAAIIGQLLETLTAAHARRIVHRDIKPANLFLTADGVVKVLDFGIARALDRTQDSAQLTGAGMPVGTPAFMAPEQALGKSDEIDARTDVWATGATMFTLLSGHTVHETDMASQALVRAATAPAPPLASVAPNVPAPLAKIVDRALAFDRRERWASAAEMREALAGACRAVGVTLPSKEELAGLSTHHAGSPTSTRTNPFAPTSDSRTALDPNLPSKIEGTSVPVSSTGAPRPRAFPRFSLRTLAVVATGLSIVTAAAGGFLVYRARARAAQAAAAQQATPATARSSQGQIPVLILGFDVQASEPLLDSTLDHVFTFALFGSERIDPFSGSRLDDLAKTDIAGDRQRIARDLATRLGTKVIVVRGTVAAKGRGFVITIRATDAEDYSVVFVATREASDIDHVVSAVALLASDLRAKLGDAVSDPSLLDKSGLSDSLEADHDFALGAELTQTDQLGAGAAHLEHAIVLDPHFNEAHEMLGIAYYDLGRRVDSTREFELAARPGAALSRRRRLRIEGDRASMVGDNDAAIAAFEEILRTWPHDSQAAVALAETYVMKRDMRRALEIGRPIAAEHPRNAAAMLNLAAYELLAGDFRGAADVANGILTAFPHVSPTGYVVLGTSQALLGQTAEATSTYESVERTTPALAAFGLADLAAMQGRWDDEAAALGRAVALETAGKGMGQGGLVWAVLAELRLRRGDKAGALAAAAKALSSDDPWVLYTAGAVYAGAGNDKKALALSTRAVESLAPDARIVSKLLVADALREEHKADEALKAIEEARKIADAWMVHWELARTYVALGDTESAERELELCVRRKGEGALAYLNDTVPTLRYVGEASSLLESLRAHRGATPP